MAPMSYCLSNSLPSSLTFLCSPLSLLILLRLASSFSLGNLLFFHMIIFKNVLLLTSLADPLSSPSPLLRLPLTPCLRLLLYGMFTIMDYRLIKSIKSPPSSTRTLPMPPFIPSLIFSLSEATGTSSRLVNPESLYIILVRLLILLNPTNTLANTPLPCRNFFPDLLIIRLINPPAMTTMRAFFSALTASTPPSPPGSSLSSLLNLSLVQLLLLFSRPVSLITPLSSSSSIRNALSLLQVSPYPETSSEPKNSKLSSINTFLLLTLRNLILLPSFSILRLVSVLLPEKLGMRLPSRLTLWDNSELKSMRLSPESSGNRILNLPEPYRCLSHGSLPYSY